MKIAVNMRAMEMNQLEGIGWFTHEVMSRIVCRHPEHEFLFLFDRPADPAFRYASNVKIIEKSPRSRHPLLWYLWFEHTVPSILRKEKADLFVSAEMYTSLRLSVPSLITLHDLSILHYPEQVKWSIRKYFFHYYPLFAARAGRIVTVSEYSKKDITERLKVPGEKVDVVYNGAHEAYRPVDAATREQIKAEFAGGKEYFLYVGSLHPRKNIDRLLAAFDRYKSESGSEKKLLLAGRKAWMTRDIKRVYEQMEHREEVRFLGYQPVSSLARIMAGAWALTYVSLFEGFGIPLLEAMKCGVPCLTSNVSSMPEVAGDAAILVDPLSVEDISRGLSEIDRPGQREKLAARCGAQSRPFSWDQTAARFWESIQSLT